MRYFCSNLSSLSLSRNSCLSTDFDRLIWSIDLLELISTRTILMQLLDAKYINRLAMQEAELGAKSYTVLEMLTDLKKGIFSELTGNKPISLNRRNLQKVYVIKL